VKKNGKKYSLLAYLPAIYQQQAEKEGDPLRALLSVFEDFFSGIEKKIDTINNYFDPYLTPALPDKNGKDFLSWLASWTILELDESWSEKKKRYLIKNAALLYRYRGTFTGLKYIIEQFFDIEVEIKEWNWPDGMKIGTRSSIGVNTILIEKTDIDLSFMIILKPSNFNIENRDHFIRKIRTVIDLEKPANTRCYFHLEFPGEEERKIQFMTIGINSIIGLCALN
jgi:phage tail-like protein